MVDFLKNDARGSGFRPKIEFQDFHKIREKCLREGTLFEDPGFAAADSSIYYSRNPNRVFKWLRPFEIAPNPHLFVEGASRFDVVQGELGDCWLLAAVANLTIHSPLFNRVVPKDQSFVRDYAGIFHFRFWQYGRWVDIVVDDRLPTVNGRLVYMHSKDHNEFWSALLEKAYAKLNGSYEALKGGTTTEAMEDFTGGVTEAFDLRNPPSNLYNMLLKAYERWSLIGCGVEAPPNMVEPKLPSGLIGGHAYSITKVKLVDIKTPKLKGKIQLLRVRNPWGSDQEWRGAWSDGSAEWSLITKEEKEALGLKFEADGEFWICYKDFIANFHKVEICNVSLDSLDNEEDSSKKKWEVRMYEGSWLKNCSAGGCLNFMDTFWMNPQLRINLEEVDEDDEHCTMILSLMQKNRRFMKNIGQKYLNIGFVIYTLENPDSLPKPLPQSFFRTKGVVERTKSYTNSREVSYRFKLPPGTYCVVPSSFNPGEEGDFLVRIFTEKKTNLSAHDQDIDLTKPDEEVKVPATQKDQEVQDYFNSIAGQDLQIDCYKLKEILDFFLKKEFTFDGFSLDVCRSMMAMMDIDKSGKLGLEEFKYLWADILIWKNAFKRFDSDRSGSLDILELRTALNSAGYQLNFFVLRALVLRYGKKDKIDFDDFIMSAVKLKSMIKTFQERDPNKTGRATFTLDEWIEKTLYS